MATVGHLPFVITGSSPSIHPLSRSLFHSSTDLYCDNELTSKTWINNLAVPSNENGTFTFSSSSKSGQNIIQHLQETVNLCHAYLKELSELCSIGIKTARFLTSSVQETSKITESEQSYCVEDHIISQEIADSYTEAWLHLSVMLKSIGDIVKGGILSAVQEVIADLKEKSLSYNLPLFASESNKVLMTSLFTMSHLQYEFSLYMCEALFDLVNLKPECFNPSSLFMQKSSRKESKLSEYLTLCLDSLATLRKQFMETIHGCKMRPSHKCADSYSTSDINGSGTTTDIEFNKFEYDFSDNKPLLDCNWTTTSKAVAENLLKESRRWEASSAAVHSSPTEHLSGTSKENPWVMETFSEANWLGVQTTSEEVKNIFNSEKQKSVFASHEELQNVIGLLSCQTSSPSSSLTNGSSITHLPGTLYDNKSSLLWPVSKRNCNGFSIYANEKINSDSPNLELISHSNAWPCENGLSSLWNSSQVQNSSLGTKNKSLFDPLTADIAFNQYAVENCETMLYLPSCVEEFPSANGLHAQNSKHTSWPLVGFQTQRLSNSSDSSQEGQINNQPIRESSFLLGVGCDGKDIMASIRQRRHSSGGPFPEHFRCIKSPSARTKSIDNILIEERPLKENSPMPTKPNFSTSPLLLLQKLTQPEEKNRKDNLPQGLPPSGFEGRQKQKLEKKYSLFGQVS